MRFWKYTLISASGGTTSTMTAASFQCKMNICKEHISRKITPHTKSSSDQPMVSARRWVSVVMRLSRKPTGMRS